MAEGTDRGIIFEKMYLGKLKMKIIARINVENLKGQRLSKIETNGTILLHDSNFGGPQSVN